MERPDHEEPTDAAADAAGRDDESPEEFAADIENDPAHNPPIDELKDIKGG